MLPETTLEEAAVARLGLRGEGATPEERSAAERIDRLLARRARVIEDFVFNNLDLLVQLDTAGHTDDKKDQARLLAEAFRRLAPVREDGTLAEQVRRALPDPPNPRREAFDQSLREFWEALVSDRQSRPKADGTYPSRLEVIAGARLELLGKEIERSFQRLLTSGEFLYRLATRNLTLTPAQSRRIHSLIDDFYARTNGSPSEEDNRRLFVAVLASLDEDQRPVLIRNLRTIGNKPPRTRTTPPQPDDLPARPGGSMAR
jgi:hypothetical protein